MRPAGGWAARCRSPTRTTCTSPRRAAVLRGRHGRRRRLAGRRRPAAGGGVREDRGGRPRAVHQPGLAAAVRVQPAGGFGVGGVVRDPPGGRHLAAARRRQPGHGRGLGRRPRAVALRALRRRGVRDRHRQRSPAGPRPGRQRPARAVRVPPARPLLPRPHGRAPVNARRWLGLALLAALVAAALILPEALEARERPARHPLARVILVVEENHEYRQIVGSRQAPFLNWLAAGGVLLTRYYAVTHPSLPNYMTLLAGDPLGIHGAGYACNRPGRNR